MSQRPVFGPDFIPMASGGWEMWRGAVVRSTGFGIDLVEGLGSRELADRVDAALCAPRVASDAAVAASLADEFDRAIGAWSRAIGRAAGDQRFREAVTWQNDAFVGSCLDRYASEAPRNSKKRERELAIAKYMQRYATKNESIGFFGPVAWAEWAAGPETTSARDPAGSLRTVYFEQWAIDRVAAAVAARPGAVMGVRPVLAPANILRDGLVLHPNRPPYALSGLDAELLASCDGRRTTAEVIDLVCAAFRPEPSAALILARLSALRRADVIRLDFAGPIETHPERRLRLRMAGIPDPDCRRSALADLDRLIDLKSRVADAAGDAGALAKALRRLDMEFTRVAGCAATRLAGQTYAGRTVVYEDVRSELSLSLGEKVSERLAEPLGMVLDAGRWLASEIADTYLRRFEGYHARKRARLGQEWVPLTSLLALATRDFYTGLGLPRVADPCVRELQRRWAGIIDVRSGGPRHRVAAEAIREKVRAAFPPTPARWANALYHSPDVMVASPSLAALNAGDFELVLGEVHLAFNTVEARALVEQHPDRSRLLRLAESVVGGRRVVPVAPREWNAVTSRTSPPTALDSRTFVYYAISSDDVSNAPAVPVPASALRVGRVGGRLVVRRSDAAGDLELAEVIGEYLSGVAVNALRLFPPSGHTPRVSIDNVVIQRETWHLSLRKCAFASQHDERVRFVQIRGWLDRHQLPRFAFYSVGTEVKPIFIDFTSVPLCNVLAAVVRRALAADPNGTIRISEMYPSPDHLWFEDERGGRHTCEIRTVVADAYSVAGERAA